MKEVSTTIHTVKLSVNNDYIGKDGTLDEKKAEEKKANTAGKASFGAQRNIPAKRSNLPYHTAISART